MVARVAWHCFALLRFAKAYLSSEWIERVFPLQLWKNNHFLLRKRMKQREKKRLTGEYIRYETEKTS